MKLLKGSKNYKLDSYPFCNSVATLVALFFILLAGPSCNEKDEFNSHPLTIEKSNLSASTDGVSSQSESAGNGLVNLYLENFHDPARNQLAKLLSDENYKKLIFQFYKLRSGRLTLVAFAGKQNDKEFNPDYQILGLVDENAVADIEGKEVFLGNQILDNDAVFKMLKNSINQGSKNDTSKNYVIFTPEIKRFSASGGYVVEFTIRFTNSLRDFSSQILPVGGGRLNPSPPYSTRTL